MEHQTLFMTENLSTLVSSELCRNCVKRKDCADSISTAAMVRIMSVMMTTKAIQCNDGAGLLEKEEGEKEVIVIATNK